MPENWSRAIMKMIGADQPAIKPPGAAKHQHHQHVGGPLEAQRFERDGCVVCAITAPAMPAIAAEIV